MGDALLLGPLIRQIKEQHNRIRDCHLTVITDGDWEAGCLMDVFRHLPGVDSVESIPSYIPLADSPTVARADKVFHCNNAFLQYEAAYRGDPPMGIAEFWLAHFGFSTSDAKPRYEVTDVEQYAMQCWTKAHKFKTDTRVIGIVARAGHTARDWNYDGIMDEVIDGVIERGWKPVVIDPTEADNGRAISFVGHRIPEVAALLATCNVVVTPDTGLLHLAEAVDTPTVALWGIMRPELRVKGYNTKVVPETSLGFCQANEQTCQCQWKAQQWSCLRRLTAPMILDGIEAVLNEQYGK
jgi:ADP-heptose:LPS heptosyltransferase